MPAGRILLPEGQKDVFSLTAIPQKGRSSQSGVALLMTLLVFLILVAVVYELTTTSSVEYLTAKNDADLEKMDTAIQAVLIDVMQTLKEDMEADSAGGAQEQLPADTAAASSASDSGEDEWARKIEQTLGDVRVTVIVEDENRKFNILSLLADDEKFAQESFDRLVRIIDRFRETTDRDIDASTARNLAQNLLNYMRGQNQRIDFPKPVLLSQIPGEETQPLLTMDQLLLIDGFDAGILFDAKPENPQDEIIPGLAAMLTVWSYLDSLPSGRTPGTANSSAQNAQTQNALPQGQAAAVGSLINVNTAPRAVLNSLLPESRVPNSVLEGIIRYRNFEQENLAVDEEVEEEPYDLEELYGEETVPREFFSSLADLEKVSEFLNFTDIQAKEELLQLLTVRSDVFSIFLTAQLVSADTDSLSPQAVDEEEEGGRVIRRVRSIVWRRQGNAGAEIVPIVPWEIRQDRKFELRDFPPDEMPYR